MLKKILLIASISFSFAAKAQDTTAIVSKADYISATSEQMSAAFRMMQKMIKNPEAANDMFSGFTMLGPNLWAAIKDLPDFKKIGTGNISFKVPKFEANGSWKKMVSVQGKLLQDPDDFKNLVKLLADTYKLSAADIVEKSDADMFFYWMCFANIQEPLFTAKNDKMRLIIQLNDKGILFMELSK